MPGFDGTGPAGQGPMTGGGRGFCAQPVSSLVQNPANRTGFNLFSQAMSMLTGSAYSGTRISGGRGMGNRRGMGRGRGRGRQFREWTIGNGQWSMEYAETL